MHKSLVWCKMIGEGAFICPSSQLSAPDFLFAQSSTFKTRQTHKTQIDCLRSLGIHSQRNQWQTVSGQSVETVGSLLHIRHKAGLRSVRPPSPLAEIRDVVKVPEAVLVFAGEHTRLPWRGESWRFSGELLVEVTDVFLAANGGDEGRGHLPLQQRLPVHVLEGDGEKETRKWVQNLIYNFVFLFLFYVRTHMTCGQKDTGIEPTNPATNEWPACFSVVPATNRILPAAASHLKRFKQQDMDTFCAIWLLCWSILNAAGRNDASRDSC